MAGASRRLGAASALVEGELVRGDVVVADGLIAEFGCQPAGEGIAIPGLVDLQVNGYAGIDFVDAGADALAAAATVLLADGVRAFQPTVITAPEGWLRAKIAALGRAIVSLGRPGQPAAMPIGIHVEGPFISRERPGIHPFAAIKSPDLALLRSFLNAGPVTFVTFAPELPGALDLAALLVDHGIVASAGHSDATAAEAHRGFDAGISAVTHLFNGMRPIHHREPGVAGAALARSPIRLGLIADKLHVAPELLAIVARAAPGRVYLVTDAIAAARAPDGEYRCGGVPVRVTDGRALFRDGRIGGSTRPLLEGVANLVALGIPFAAAVAAATSVPADLVRRPELGHLTVGAPADLLVVDEAVSLRRVLVAGEVVGV